MITHSDPDSKQLPAWQSKLAARGILQAALANGWQASGQGWAYPVRNAAGEQILAPDGLPVMRWKNFDSAAKPKYLWKPDGLKDVPGYYFPVGFSVDSAGIAILSCGEVDSLSANTAGLKNVFSLYGENRIPESLAGDLEGLGIKTLMYWPDLDPAGKTAANNLAVKLHGSSVSFECYLLPDFLGQGADFNRLLTYLIGRNEADKFQEILFTCADFKLDPLPNLFTVPALDPQMSLKPVITTQERDQHGLSDSEFDQWLADLFSAVASRLGVTAFNEDGWSRKPIRCLFNNHEHDDKRPAASINNQSYSFACFKCGHSAGLRDIAEKLGIDPADYYPEHVKANIKDRAIKALEGADSGNKALVTLNPGLKPEDKATEGKAGQKQNAAKEVRIVTWRQAAALVKDQFDGKIGAFTKPPLPMPYRGIARGSGFCKAIPRGKVIAIQSGSGGGKTIFIEGFIDPWIAAGFNGYLWTPEWFAAEQIWRAIQRRTGIDYTLFADDLAYTQAVANRIAPTTAPLDPQTRAIARAAADQIAALPGSVYADLAASLSAGNMLPGLNEAAAVARAEKRAIDFAVLDYAQLIMGESSAEKQHELLTRALAQFKLWCIANDAVGIVTSQMDKATANKMLTDIDATPTMESMLGVRAAIFNMVLTIVRSPAASGEMSPRARIEISKLSVGRPPAVAPHMILIPEKLQWFDEESQVKVPSVYLPETKGKTA